MTWELWVHCETFSYAQRRGAMLLHSPTRPEPGLGQLTGQEDDLPWRLWHRILCLNMFLAGGNLWWTGVHLSVVLGGGPQTWAL